MQPLLPCLILSVSVTCYVRVYIPDVSWCASFTLL